MELHELIVEMKLLERRLTLYEEKYGVLSEDFYAALMAGELARYDAFDETRADFSRWKGIYETWRRRKQAYTEQLSRCELAEALRVQSCTIDLGLEAGYARMAQNAEREAEALAWAEAMVEDGTNAVV